MSKIAEVFKTKKEKIKRISRNKKTPVLGLQLSSPLFNNHLPVEDKIKQGNMHLLYHVLTVKPVIQFSEFEIDWARNVRAIKAQARYPLVLSGLVKKIPKSPTVPREKLIEILRRPKVFIEISNECGMNVGRFLIDLHSDVAPRTVGKFATLCANYQLFKEPSYVGSEVSRLFSNLVVEFAVVPKVPKIKAENFEMAADKAGTVAMLVENGKVGAKFIITLQPLQLINQRHVIIGRVIKGFKTLLLLRNSQSVCDLPRHRFYISNCGVLPHISVEKEIDATPIGEMAEMSKLLYDMEHRELQVKKHKEVKN